MDCDCLLHPFQNDPGTSQNQRVMDDLLSGAAKIDARTMADLLNYFVQMSRHINFYDFELNVNDWQPFFKKSLPFVLASIVKFPLQSTENNLTLYKNIFESKPSASGLQLLSFSLYHRFIKSINGWHLLLNDSSLPIAGTLDTVLRSKLQAPVRQFIMYTNTASRHYGIRQIDFRKISENPVWGLDPDSITATDKYFQSSGTGAHQRMIDLYANINTLLTVFSDVITSLSYAAEINLELSFIPLKDELQKKHPPHLALLFAFLNMFRQLQSNLNEYSRKHLDYFYKEILQFKAEGAIPDRANILFKIQDALKSYLLKKGLKVRDGKDDNRQDILFELDDDIVINQTKIEDKRTLFLNNKNAYAQTYIEGVYMAPVAGMADGVEKEFADDPKNFPTLGSKYSKFTDPETRLLKPYPNARIGFVLASQVLLLQSGSSRKISIKIPCELKSICSGIRMFPGDNTRDCCNDNGNGGTDPDIIAYPNFYREDKFIDKVNAILSETYYYISEDLLKAGKKKGISGKLADQLRDLFLTEKANPLCYCPVNQRKLEVMVPKPFFDDVISDLILDGKLTPGEEQILKELLESRRAFNFLLSGEEEWIEPSSIEILELTPPPLPGSNEFTLNIELRLTPEKSAVTFYNQDVLSEDLGTTLPLLKVELDDKIKFTGLDLSTLAEEDKTDGECCPQEKNCCLLKKEKEEDVSLYHFFRNVIVKNDEPENEIIKVEVCGMKKFIVQNDESVMDVNGPVYPFGSRPEILNFDINKLPVAGTLIGPSFYIGSEEIFFKKWDCLVVNLKWKDRPADFGKYYDAYLKNGLNIDNFHVGISVLEDGNWKIEPNKRKLFSNSDFWTPPPPNPPPQPDCNPDASSFDNVYTIYSDPLGAGTRFIKDQVLGTKLEKTTLNGFLRINMQDQDFLHKDYSFVLARQMMAFGRYPDLIDGAMYYDAFMHPIVFDISLFFLGIGPRIITAAKDLVNSGINGILNDLITIISNKISAGVNSPLLNGLLTEIINLVNQVAAIATITPAVFLGGLDVTTLSAAKQSQINDKVKNFYVGLFALLNTNLTGIENDLKAVIQSKFTAIDVDGILTNLFGEKQVIIPKEPWTPILSNIFLDYTAKATLQDIDLIHLYPYQGTYKAEELNLQPALFPTYCDEGTLFLGLSNLVPGNNLNLLFQMAEATSDSESDKENVFWHYLDSNVWKSLRPGFEVLDDATNNLTGSGIIKLALPANMTSENTIMPAGMHWIKATIPKNSGGVCETTGIHPHAVHVVFTNEEANNKLRLSKPLQAESISKLEVADASVKSVIQPYESFGGLVPEIEQQFYIRVSETLRHKGRAIQAFDYERLVLQAFPQLFKVKCINHNLALNAHEFKNDFPYAGGYVMMVVIPDLNKLKAGNSFEPKAPVSLLDDINEFIRQRTSTFVRFRAMNPRYEQVDLCLKIRLQKGKDENYHKEQVREDIRRFLAPWAVGDYYKLTFGQCVYRSDIIQFLETRDYLDFIGDLRMAKKGIKPDGLLPKVCPDTPRSILIAGDIEVCIIPPECEDWGNYSACYETSVKPCDTKPEQITDYCKKRKIINT